MFARASDLPTGVSRRRASSVPRASAARPDQRTEPDHRRCACHRRHGCRPWRYCSRWPRRLASRRRAAAYAPWWRARRGVAAGHLALGGPLLRTPLAGRGCLGARPADVGLIWPFSKACAAVDVASLRLARMRWRQRGRERRGGSGRERGRQPIASHRAASSSAAATFCRSCATNCSWLVSLPCSSRARRSF